MSYKNIIIGVTFVLAGFLVGIGWQLSHRPADINHDGRVNLTDLSLLLSDYDR